MGLLGSILGGGGGGSKAAGIQVDYANKALDIQKQTYNDAKGLTAPYYAAGTGALSKLLTYLGISDPVTTSNFQLPSSATAVGETDWGYANIGGDAQYANLKGNEQWKQDPTTGQWYVRYETGSGPKNKGVGAWQPIGDTITADMTDPNYGSLLADYQYEEDPGYQFQLDQGNKAIERKLAATGKTFTPEAVKALTEYGIGTANQNYNEGFQRDQQKKASIYGMLSGTAGMGQTATGQQIAAGSNYANAATDLYTGMGNVLASGKQADQANRGSMFNTLLGAGVGYATGGWSGALAGLLK